MYEKISINEELKKIISGEIKLENEYVEIKETFRLSDKEIESYKKNNKYEVRGTTINGKQELQNYFKYICARSIASFLNAKGGRLYIGIVDNANPLRDIKGFVMLENLDKTNQDLNNFLENTFTEIITQACIKTNFININNKYICVIEIKKVSQDEWPVLIGSYNKRKEDDFFYVRKNDRSINIKNTKKIIEQVKNYISSNQIPKPKNNDWSKDEFLLLTFIERRTDYDDDMPKQLIVLHDKGWEKGPKFDDVIDHTTSDRKRDLIFKDLYVDDLVDNVLRFLGNKVKLNFNYGMLVEISIGNSKQKEIQEFSDIIKKLEVINGKNLRKFWNLEILQIITSNNKIIYTLPDNEENYKNAVGNKISGYIVEFEDLTFISDIHINNDIDFDIVEDLNSDKTKTKYHYN